MHLLTTIFKYENLDALFTINTAKIGFLYAAKIMKSLKVRKNIDSFTKMSLSTKYIETRFQVEACMQAELQLVLFHNKATETPQFGMLY